MRSFLKYPVIVFLMITCMLAIGTPISFAAPLSISGEHFTMRNGLPSNTVRTITQDLQGKIWLGTTNGVATYDGYIFKNVAGLTTGDDKNVQNIIPDELGNIWIISSSGKITCYDARRETPRMEINNFSRKGKYSHVVFYPDSLVCLWGKEDGFMLIDMRKSTPDFKMVSLMGKVSESNLSLPEKCIINFVIRNEGNIWIGTSQGLFAYTMTNRQLKTINGGSKFLTAVRYGKDLLFYSSDGNIYKADATLRAKEIGKLKNHIIDDNYKGNILYNDKWYIFGRDRVNCFDLKTGRETSVPDEFNKPAPRISHDNERDTWIIGQDGGVTHINSSTGSITKCDFINSNARNSNGNAKINRLRFCNTPDIIWIASNGDGLYAYDKRMEESCHWTRNSNNYDTGEIAPLVSDRLLSVFQDKSGSLWIGYEQDGLSHIHVSDNRWVNYIFPDDTRGNFGDISSFRMVSNTSNGMLFTGNRANTLLSLDKDMSVINKTLYPQSVYAVESDTTGTLWIGMKYGGLIVGNSIYKNTLHDTSSLGDNNVFDILRDHKGRMWIATFGGGLDLAVRDENGNIVFEHFLDGNQKGRHIRTIAEDKNGYLWIGSSNGVAIINPDEIITNTEIYLTLNVENGLLDSDEIRHIWCSTSGDVYIAQTGMGFAKVKIPKNKDYSKLKIEKFNMSNGLCSDMVKAFTEDNDGYIWIATEYGLSRFDKNNHIFDNYYPSLNMEGNVFNETAAAKTEDGRLIFGSGRGLCVINPKELIIKRDTVNIRDVIIDIEDKNVIAKFYTYDFAANTPNKFSYKILESGEEWSTPRISNSVEIHNLSYGKHTLAVKAVGDNGVWSEIYTVDFEIPTPLYLSWWAIIIYVLLVVCISYFIFKITSDRLKLSEQMSLTKKLTEAQMSFFKKISESFRTPLTLIKGNIEKLISSNGLTTDARNELSQMDYYAEQLIATMHNLTLIKTEFLKGHFILKEELPIIQPENTVIPDDGQIDIPDTEIPLNEQTVLIVEPDDSLRTHLQKSLSKYFNIIVTDSGTSAMEVLKSKEISIVVSAAIMPELSGIEMLKYIRRDPHTNHIPVILLTAFDTTENIVQGTEAGADAYLRKPFSTRIILANIINLLNQRARLRNRYSNDLALSEPKVFDNKQDQTFIEKFDKLIDAHISDGNFSVDEAAVELGVGRTVFYKKVKLLTNYTPNDYIRFRRMKLAAKLLAEGSHTISEVSYLVGITDPLYFSRSFKKHFGVAPSVYVKNLKDSQSDNT